MANYFDQFDAADEPNFFDQFDEAAPEEEKGLLDSTLSVAEDTGRLMARGVGGMVAGAGWLADRAGAETVGKGAMELGESVQDYWSEGLSEEQKAASQKKFFEQDANGDYSFGDAWSDPRAVLGGVAESIPGTALGMGLGAVATRGLVALGGRAAIAGGFGAGGLGTALEKGFSLIPVLGPKMAAALGYGAGETAVAAGSIGKGAEDRVRQLPDEVLDEHTEFQLALARNEGDREKARDEVARAAGGDAAALGSLLTFGFSAPAGAIMANMLSGVAMRATRGRAVGTAVGGEAGQEFFQSGGEQFAQNRAIRENADPNQSLDEDVLNQAVTGAAAGGVMGLPGGFATRLEDPNFIPPGQLQQPEGDLADRMAGAAQSPFADAATDRVAQARRQAAAAGADPLQQELAAAREFGVVLDATPGRQELKDGFGPTVGLLEGLQQSQARYAEQQAGLEKSMSEEDKKARQERQLLGMPEEQPGLGLSGGIEPQQDLFSAPPESVPYEALRQQLDSTVADINGNVDVRQAPVESAPNLGGGTQVAPGQTEMYLPEGQQDLRPTGSDIPAPNARTPLQPDLPGTISIDRARRNLIDAGMSPEMANSATEAEIRDMFRRAGGGRTGAITEIPQEGYEAQDDLAAERRGEERLRQLGKFKRATNYSSSFEYSPQPQAIAVQESDLEPGVIRSVETPSGNTIPGVRKGLMRSPVGRALQMLESSGALVIVQSEEDLPEGVRKAIGTSKTGEGSVQGVTYRGRMYIVADGVQQGDEFGVFVHEGKHYSIERAGNEQLHQIIQTRFQQLLQEGDTAALEAENQAAPERDTDPDVYFNERTAYFVEYVVNNPGKASNKAKLLVARIIADVRAWFAQTKPGMWLASRGTFKLSPQDIVSIIRQQTVAQAKTESAVNDARGAQMSKKGKRHESSRETEKHAAADIVAPPAQAEARLRKTLARKPGVGAPALKKAKRFELPNKQVAYLGPVTTAQWKERVESTMTADQIKKARKWYQEIDDAFSFIKDTKTRHEIVVGWLAANKNESPQGALRNALRVREQVLANATGVKGGLSDAALRQLFKDGVISDPKGLGAKLFDFIDSYLGHSTRTMMGNDPRGGEPAVVDVHTARDVGFLDPVLLKFISKRFGEKAVAGLESDVPVDEKGGAGAVSEPQYEWGAERLRQITADLNKEKWLGGDLLPSEVQAIGWMAITTQLRDAQSANSEDSIKQNTRTLAWEAIPGGGSQYAGLKDPTGEITAQIAEKVREAFTTFAGTYEIESSFSYGGWKDSVSPNVLTNLLASSEGAQLAGSIIGFLTQQDAVMILHEKPVGGQDLSIAAIDSSGKLDLPMLEDVWSRIRQAYPKAIGFSPASENGKTGFQIVFQKEPGKGTDKLQAELENDLLPVLQKISDDLGLTLSVSGRKVSVEFLANDWKESPDGSGYMDGVEQRLGKARAQELRDYFRKSIEPLYRKAAPKFSRARVGSAKGDVGLSAATPRYGNAKAGAVSVIGIHFSGTQRTELSGAKYGTGIRGAEARRVQFAGDGRLKNRIYFYVPEGTSVVPEAGVGRFAHRAILENVYPIKEDPLKLWRQDPNEMETAILDAGFDGYYVPSAFQAKTLDSKFGAVVLLGDQTVPVEPVGTTDSPQFSRSPRVGKPLSQIEITETVENVDTGETVQVRYNAARAVSQIDKKIEMARKLVGCLS